VSRDCIPGWWSWPYRPESQGGARVSQDFPRHACISLECDDAEGGGEFGFWGLVCFRSSRDSGSCTFAALLRLRPVRPARSAWHEMPGWAFSGSSVALQGQLSARTCRATGGTRGMLRAWAMVDWCAPGGRVGCRGISSGVGANASPGTGISCNRRARCRGGAKSWPYRPESQGGRGGVAGLSMSCV
jgi:hypothetical protein